MSTMLHYMIIMKPQQDT